MRVVAASPTITLDTAVKALQASGQGVINLSVGELDFAPPASVVAAVTHQTTEARMNRYSPVTGLPAAKQAVIDYEQHQHSVQYQSDQVLITNGAKQALYVAFQALLEPGEEVLVIQPAWVSYVEQIKLAGGCPVSVETDDQFMPTIQAIEQAITAKTVGLVLNYPNNPTGAVYPAALLLAIAELAKKHQWWVISDEIYEHIVYDGVQFNSFARYYDHTIVVNGLSKASAITGWRVGYAVGPNTLIAAMAAVQSHFTGNVSNVMQAAIQPALQLGLPADWLVELQQRRQLIIDWLVDHPVLKLVAPQGAFYCFIDCRALNQDSVTLCDRILKEARVAVVPGQYFGRDGYVRLSFANPLPQLQQAIQRIDQVVL